jgi:hypothetical protein
MKRPFFGEYRGFTLRCAPQPTEDARYLPFCIISHGSSHVCVDHAGVLDLPTFSDEETAALASWGAATRWIDDSIGRQVSTQRTVRSADMATAIHHLMPQANATRDGALLAALGAG